MHVVLRLDWLSRIGLPGSHGGGPREDDSETSTEVYRRIANEFYMRGVMPAETTHWRAQREGSCIGIEPAPKG